MVLFKLRWHGYWFTEECKLNANFGFWGKTLVGKSQMLNISRKTFYGGLRIIAKDLLDYRCGVMIPIRLSIINVNSIPREF